MYGWIWRHLPGGRPLGALCAALRVAGVVALLFFVVFPAVEPHLPWNNITVDRPAGHPG